MEKYIKSGLLFDFFSFFAYFAYYLSNNVSIFIKIIFYIRVYTLSKINVQIEGNLIANLYSSSFYRFIKMVFLIIFLNILSGCIYFAIDYSYYVEQGFNYQRGYLWLTSSSVTFNLNII